MNGNAPWLDASIVNNECSPGGALALLDARSYVRHLVASDLRISDKVGGKSQFWFSPNRTAGLLPALLPE